MRECGLKVAALSYRDNFSCFGQYCCLDLSQNNISYKAYGKVFNLFQSVTKRRGFNGEYIEVLFVVNSASRDGKCSVFHLPFNRHLATKVGTLIVATIYL